MYCICIVFSLAVVLSFVCQLVLTNYDDDDDDISCYGFIIEDNYDCGNNVLVVLSCLDDNVFVYSHSCASVNPRRTHRVRAVGR